MSAFSFIGPGNMGGAILKSACKYINPENITITDKDKHRVSEYEERLGVKSCKSNGEATSNSDFILICVKPQQISEVLKEIEPVLTARRDKGEPAVLVSIAAGVTIESIKAYVGETQPVVRVMPNLPALIGKGVMLVSGIESCPEEKRGALMTLLSASGEIIEIPEIQMDMATAASSCSPAFAFIFIEALADGAVFAGLPRTVAVKLAANALLGSAAMSLESGYSLSELKDMVCSPAGSTIRGVASLEESAFRSAVIKAYLASYDRNNEMGK